MDRRYLLLAGLLLAGACGGTGTPADTTPGFDDLLPQVASGKASGFSVQPAQLGGSYDLRVEPRVGDSLTPLNASVFELEVPPGQSFALVLRRADEGPVHPFLALYDGLERTRLQSSCYQGVNCSQGMLYMADPRDAVVVHTQLGSGRLLVFAADLELDDFGRLQLDVIPLDHPSGTFVPVAHAGTDALNEHLRSQQPLLDGYLQQGVLQELPDGRVACAGTVMDLDGEPSCDLTNVPLSERNGVEALMLRINDLRQHLFDELRLIIQGDEDLPASIDVTSDDIARICARLWQALGGDTHRLRGE